MQFDQSVCRSRSFAYAQVLRTFPLQDDGRSGSLNPSRTRPCVPAVKKNYLHPMKRILRLLLSFFLLTIIVLLSLINLRLHHTPDLRIEGTDTINRDLLTELRGLNSAFQNKADADMQRLYPEGYVFLNAIYASSLTNFIDSLDKETLYFKEGYREIHNAWSRIDSETGRSTFHEITPGNFGAFYSGWNNYVLGKKLSLQHSAKRDTLEVNYFRKQCETIATSFKESVYPVSYTGASWPADAMVCIASLSLHDKLFAPLYSQLITQWVSVVKANLDSNGLIPHAADSNGKPTENARGSSQSLMLIFLKDIDHEFATQQFTLYKSLFLDSRFGLIGIREYPNNATSTGTGDIDSGPVILEFGSAATLVGMHTLYRYGDHTSSASIRNEIEAFGFPTTDDDKKTYLLGKLPIADAFIAWGHSAGNISEDYSPGFVIIHLYSFLVIGVLGLGLWAMWRR